MGIENHEKRWCCQATIFVDSSLYSRGNILIAGRTVAINTHSAKKVDVRDNCAQQTSTAHDRRTALCALAVMTKAPQAGKVKTRLVPPLTPDEAAALNICFLRDTTAA